MAADDGDDDDVPMGPPPDPSVRPWRHPSEIAAANAAAQRALPDHAGASTSKRFQPSRHVLIAGSTLGVIGLLAVLSGIRPSSPFDGGLAQQASLLTTVSVTVTDDKGLGSDESETSEGADATAADLTSATTSDGDTPSTLVSTTLETPRPAWLETGPRLVVSVFEPGATEQVASGVLVDGVVLTSAQALRGLTTVEIVIDPNAGRIPAEVRGVDPFNDLAVVVVDAVEGSIRNEGTTAEASLFNAAIDTSDPAQTPMSPGATVWMIVADSESKTVAFEGTIASIAQDATTSDGQPILDALITSIVMPPAGAGAALVDDQGRIIGMVAGCSEHFVNAVPIEALRLSADSILRTGMAHVGWLGLNGHGSDEEGVQVSNVEADSPAASAGILAGDLIVAIDGEPVDQMSAIIRSIRRAGPGGRFSITVERGGSAVEIEVTVGSRT